MAAGVQDFKSLKPANDGLGLDFASTVTTKQKIAQDPGLIALNVDFSLRQSSTKLTDCVNVGTRARKQQVT
jgi:hypothetical protein